jgi:pimeloyl-ACP methyl ester carboxylesterase
LNLPVFLQTVDSIGEGIPAEGIFSGPTLFLRGGMSDYVKDSDWPLILERFPHAELETISQAGHWVHADAPQEFSNIFLPFIQKHIL